MLNEEYFIDFHLTLISVKNSFPGWQPGIEEAAADWDEEWDKFEDEGTLL